MTRPRVVIRLSGRDLRRLADGRELVKEFGPATVSLVGPDGAWSGRAPVVFHLSETNLAHLRAGGMLTRPLEPYAAADVTLRG